MAKTGSKTFNAYLEEGYIKSMRDYAKEKNMSVSQLLRNLIDKYIRSDKENIKIVLNIPRDILQTPESLEKWLNSKSVALLNHFKDSSH
jgi:hypothetical protein